MLATIDRAELERLRERYPYRPNARRINAYEDAASGSIARRHSRFSILAAARVIFSTSLGSSVTKDLALTLTTNLSFAAQPSISAFAASLHGFSRKRRCLILERNLI